MDISDEVPMRSLLAEAGLVFGRYRLGSIPINCDCCAAPEWIQAIRERRLTELTESNWLDAYFLLGGGQIGEISDFKSLLPEFLRLIAERDFGLYPLSEAIINANAGDWTREEVALLIRFLELASAADGDEVKGSAVRRGLLHTFADWFLGESEESIRQKALEKLRGLISADDESQDVR